MKLVLTRSDYGPKGTYGFLSVESGPPRFVTLELPWLDNQKQISCIPKGTYKIIRHNSPKFGKVWKVENVPGRSEILIHTGNFLADIQGCILLGKGLIPTGITNSRLAVAEFMEILKDKSDAELEIK